MAGTWILCPNLWGARLFEFDSRLSTVRFLREFPRPRTRTRLEDFHDADETDEISRPIESPELERRVAEEFMGYLAQEMEKAAGQARYSNLVVCAEIQLLTILQERLGEGSRARLAGAVALDLYEVNESDLVSYVVSGVRDIATAPRKAG